MAFRNKSAIPRALAASLGVTVERAPIRDPWFLIGDDGEKLVSERGTTAFSTERAFTLLKKSQPPTGD